MADTQHAEELVQATGDAPSGE